MILDILNFLPTIIVPILSGSFFLFTVWAALHAILYKRDSKAAFAWVGLIILSPGIGAALYYIFGINRIQKKAIALKHDHSFLRALHPILIEQAKQRTFVPVRPPQSLPQHIATLMKYGDSLLQIPITEGNAVSMLENGEKTFPEMLHAIKNAKQSIGLETYIFDNDRQGKLFVQALRKAKERGVDVRVLIDSVGAKYTFPSIVYLLKKHRIPHALFLPSLLPWNLSYANLRNHRKILVIDGKLGFTGGMNIRYPYTKRKLPRLILQDTHFKFEGPIIAHLRHIFIEDWLFSTNEQLQGGKWLPTLGAIGTTIARGIPDGPDEDFEQTEWMILGAIARAKKSILIQTPYFVPNMKLTSALSVAALSGIHVTILLPEKGNLRIVEWAAMAKLWQVLEKGCRIYLYPPPFDHSKLMVVDDVWVLVGSSNWDARSLRLNFEFNVECYDKQLALKVKTAIKRKIAYSQEMTLADVENLVMWRKLRNGVARLFAPYL